MFIHCPFQHVEFWTINGIPNSPLRQWKTLPNCGGDDLTWIRRIQHLKQCHSHTLELLAVCFCSGANSYCLAFTIAAYKYTQWNIDRPRIERYSYWNCSNSPQFASVDPYPYSCSIVLGSNNKCQSVANFRIAPCCLPNPVPNQWKIFKNTANFGPNTTYILSWESWVMTSRGFSMHITESENRALQEETSKIEKASVLHVPCEQRLVDTNAMMQCEKLAPSPQKEQPTMWRCR